MRPPRCCQQPDGVAQEAVRGDAAPLRIGRREMLADVAGADRAQHRVGQGMQGHVGVGVAGQRLGVRDGDAAQHHGIARAEAMDVEAERGARFHRRCLPEILGGGDLAVIVVARDHDNPETGALGDRGIVGERRGLVAAERRGGAMRLEQGGDSGRPAAFAPATGGRAAPFRRWRPPASTRFSVSASGTPRTAPSMPGADRASRQAAISPGADEGAGGIVDGDQVRRPGGQRFQAVQHRMLPAGAARRPAAAGQSPAMAVW